MLANIHTITIKYCKLFVIIILLLVVVNVTS